MWLQPTVELQGADATPQCPSMYEQLHTAHTCRHRARRRRERVGRGWFISLEYAGRGWHAGFNRAASTEVEQATIVPRIRSGIAARRGRPARRDLRGPTDEHEPVA